MKRLGAVWGGVIVAGIMSAATPVYAADALIEGAKQCTQYFPVKERQYGIPVHLLAAISSIETGRYHKGLGMPLPWPWTINVEGKGYFFNSKAEAVAETQRHLKMGKRSIDVGCMQVNLKHHAGAFASLDEAFDPEKNVDYAARFLKNNYSDLGNSWVKAAAAYHSRTPSRGNPYLQKVAKAWQNIVTKVQQAQARTGGVAQPVASAPVVQQSYKVANSPNASAQEIAVAFKEEPKAAAKPMRKIESTRNVKVITVNESAAAKRANVVVVTPVSAQQAANYAPQAGTPQSAPVTVTAQPPPIQPRRVVVEDTLRPAGRSPTFVFSN